ncbi:hypothetical protein B0H67DRAFT_641997 [Lasiosphaeris hirsuta]|uniref:Protein kinase domain-containing protein n=1 Tax=Lasiosphaeris hirsuta TaxID=260670 RepID=A0AA40E6A8_9PEZI|nr:hypothetical protein B0H67DRAFT_641997 [Lasiosphaeris hirsuta]
MIHKARIHPAHHNFHRITASDYFAIKQLEGRDEGYSKKEIEASRMLGRHPRVCLMLAAFEFQNAQYLILPWADGGNLVDLWKAHPNVGGAITPELQLWFLGECLGLAEVLNAIYSIHISYRIEVKKPRIENTPGIIPKSISEAQLYSDDDPNDDGSTASQEHIFGRHSDIKPQNILCFTLTAQDPIPDAGYGHLRISDFGVTKFHRDVTQFRDNTTQTGWTPTYGAPEIEEDPS